MTERLLSVADGYCRPVKRKAPYNDEIPQGLTITAAKKLEICDVYGFLPQIKCNKKSKLVMTVRK